MTGLEIALVKITAVVVVIVLWRVCTGRWR